jgi:hypothetical protein
MVLLCLSSQIDILFLVLRILEFQPGEPQVELYFGLLLQLLTWILHILEVNQISEVLVGEGRALVHIGNAIIISNADICKFCVSRLH